MRMGGKRRNGGRKRGGLIPQNDGLEPPVVGRIFPVVYLVVTVCGRWLKDSTAVNLLIAVHSHCWDMSCVFWVLCQSLSHCVGHRRPPGLRKIVLFMSIWLTSDDCSRVARVASEVFWMVDAMITWMEYLYWIPAHPTPCYFGLIRMIAGRSTSVECCRQIYSLSMVHILGDEHSPMYSGF